MRRLLLVSGAALLLSAYPFRVRAYDQAVEVEGSPYGGSASGQFALSDAAGCATWAPPAARVRYGGVGVTLRVRDVPAPVPNPVVPEPSNTAAVSAEPEPAPESEPVPPRPRWKRRGFIFQASAALERQTYKLLAPAQGETDGLTGPAMMVAATNVPSPMTRGVLGARFGNDWQYLGASAGALAFTHVGGVDLHTCTTSSGSEVSCVNYPVDLTVFPDLQARIGPFYPFHVDLGLGSYNVMTLTHPGLYLGAIAGNDAGWEIAVHYGSHANFQGTFSDRNFSSRGDIGLKVPVTSAIRLGANGAIYEGFDRDVEYSGALSIEVGIGSMESP